MAQAEASGEAFLAASWNEMMVLLAHMYLAAIWVLECLHWLVLQACCLLLRSYAKQLGCSTLCYLSVLVTRLL